MIFTHKIIGFQSCTINSYYGRVLPSILEAGNYITWQKKNNSKNACACSNLNTYPLHRLPVPVGYPWPKQLNKHWFWKGMLKRVRPCCSHKKHQLFIHFIRSKGHVFLYIIICTPCSKFMSCLKWSINSPCSLHVHYPGCPDSGQEMLQTKMLPFGRHATCKVMSHRLFLELSRIQSPQSILLFMFFPIQIPSHLDLSSKVTESIWGSMIIGQELGTKCVSMNSNPILWLVPIW